MMHPVIEPRHSRSDEKDSGVHFFFGKISGKRIIDFLPCSMYVDVLRCMFMYHLLFKFSLGDLSIPQTFF